MILHIQNGIYHIPSWLSPESITLLRLMLQVNSTKRIRIDDLLRHPWLINHTYSEPVRYESIYQVYFIFRILQFKIIDLHIGQIRSIMYTRNGFILRSDG
jgi:hypothetical protein